MKYFVRQNHFRQKKIFDNIGQICGTTDNPVFGLWGTSALGFKARVYPLVYILHYLDAN